MNVLILVFLLGAGLAGCSDYTEETVNKTGGSNELLLSYSISGAEVQTYAVPGLAHECTVDHIYTLFFRDASHSDPGRFVGYTRTGVSASSASGSARVTMPGTEDITDAWQLLFIANLDLYANLNGASSVDTWLEDLLEPAGVGVNISTAKTTLTAIANQSTGIGSPLLMSGEFAKASGTNLATVSLSRRVARIDVVNDESNFILESAQVWNARTMAYIMESGGTMTGTTGNDFRHYTGLVATTSTSSIEGQLYAFPNSVATPVLNDNETTCLIIGGKYNNGPTTYYRVNVCAASNSQHLKGNGIYTITIKSVSDDGETDPGDAHNNNSLALEYTINEWDDSYTGLYVFDADGNGLAVSQRYVTFSPAAPQEIEIEVYRIYSVSHPLASDWSVGTMAGVDASLFSANKTIGDVTNTRFTISVATENSSTTDREAVLSINWGTISVSVDVSQLNPTSQMDGILLSPSDMWFSLAGGTQEVCLNLMGNYSGINSGAITYSIVYDSSDTGWLTVAPTTSDITNGLYYYNITANPLSTIARSASVKYVVTQGAKISTGLLTVRQTTVDVGDGGFKRQLVVYLTDKNKNIIPGGTLTDQYQRFQGLPTGQSGANHLHFPIYEREEMKYKFEILSSLGWKVVAPGNAGSRLDFTLYSHGGDFSNWIEFYVSAKQDVESGWDGYFYIEYEDGYKSEYVVHQQGVFALLASNQNYYYYGTFQMNGKLWLDRTLGATIGMDPDNPEVGYYGHANSTIYQDPNARGIPMTQAIAQTACPAGFRLPKKTAGSGEWDWLFGDGTDTNSALKWSGTTGNLSSGGVKYPYVFYVTINDSPLQRFLLPMNYSANYGYYWAYEAGYEYLYLRSDTGVRQWTTGGASSQNYVRCVRDK